MAGLLREDDVSLVKEKTPIEAVVREHVTLARAGMGSLKGLCPLHDERTPSFHVRPAHGHWHCFGCGEGGDVISFVQKVEHLTFVEAVERLADKAGIELRRDSSRVEDSARGRRTRLLEAHRAAEELYASALLEYPEARIGRDFLRQRGFDSEAAGRFGVGYAPKAGDVLTRHLLGRGFGEDDLVIGGLCGRSSRGLYDRFRGRLVWPVRDVTGATVGFGARRLWDDDRIEAKYLNTTETPIYKKTALLYGLDLAKKSIAAERRAVVVEGYTDVMAMHLAGVTTAVATCGTAFGADHVRVLRRLLRDDGQARAVFTFDGDSAGQKAAMRAFELDDKWVSQSYVAVAEGGMDPCDLRLASGDAAVELLVEQAVPMFEFAARTKIGEFDLDTGGGQAQAVHEVASILAGIRDSALETIYLHKVAAWIGVPIDLIAAEVATAKNEKRSPRESTSGRRSRSGPATDDPATGRAEAEEADAQVDVYPAPDLSERYVNLQYQLLQVLLQYPRALSDSDIMPLVSARFTDAGLAAVLRAALTHWGEHLELSSAAWVDVVEREAGDAALRLVSELAVTPIRARSDPQTGLPDSRYVSSLIVAMQEVTLEQRIAETGGALRRAEGAGADPQRMRAISVELTELQRQLATLRQRESK